MGNETTKKGIEYKVKPEFAAQRKCVTPIPSDNNRTVSLGKDVVKIKHEATAKADAYEVVCEKASEKDLQVLYETHNLKHIIDKYVDGKIVDPNKPA